MSLLLQTVYRHFVYYTNEFIVQNGDPMTSQWFGMSDPWFFFFLGLVLISIIQIWIPLYQKFLCRQKNHVTDYKPIMLILNGNAFGGYSVGILLATYLARWGLDSFDCKSYDPNTSDLKQIGLRYLAYLLIYTKVYDFIRPLLSALSQRHHNITWLQLLHLQTSLIVVWYSVKVNPGSVFILLALVDTYYQILVYAYLVMSTASDDLKPSKRFKKNLLIFRVTSCMISLVHSFYFMLQEECGSFEIRFLTFIYTAMYLAFLPLDLFIRSKKKQLYQWNRKGFAQTNKSIRKSIK